MRPLFYEFEGKMMKVSEIHQIIPVLCKDVLVKYLRRGMKTREEILAFNPRSKSECARIGKKSSNWKNFKFSWKESSNNEQR